MDDFMSLLFGIMNNNYETAEKVGRTQVGPFTVDTCYTVDCGWETAVWKNNNPMIIVARYNTKEEAEQGHEDWCAVCLNNPVSAWSVQTEEYETF